MNVQLFLTSAGTPELRLRNFHTSQSRRLEYAGRCLVSKSSIYLEDRCMSFQSTAECSQSFNLSPSQACPTALPTRDLQSAENNTVQLQGHGFN